jgi:PAS domain-containing protein
MATDELRAVLAAYQQVVMASWPELHPAMPGNSLRWGRRSEIELRAELEGYLQEAAPPRSSVRVFWKIGPQFRFAGCNELFAKDAGMTREELIGKDDYDKRLPWFPQAATYRMDDEDVVKSGKANLDILDHQRSSTGMTWVRAGKAPIRTEEGQVIGIFGMYEVLDGATGRRLFAQREGIR